MIGLLLSEFALRLYGHFRPSFVFYDSYDVPYERFRGKPYSMDWDTPLNSHGFKDAEYSEAKAPGTYRIVGLGDSFVYGVVPYRFNFLTLAEKLLREAGLPVEIINMGIVSTGPKDYLSLLAREGLQLGPDLVLVHFFIGNDFDARPLDLDQHLYLWRLARYAWTVSRHYEGLVVHGEAKYEDDQPSMDAAKFLEVEHARFPIYDSSDPFLSSALESAALPLVKIRDLLSARKSRLLVVLIPDEMQVEDDLWSQVVENAGRDRSTIDRDRPQRVIAERLQRAGIETMDLLPAFREAARGQRLYRLRDTHWNIAGNAFAAKLIAQRIQTIDGAPKAERPSGQPR